MRFLIKAIYAFVSTVFAAALSSHPVPQSYQQLGLHQPGPHLPPGMHIGIFSEFAVVTA